MTLTPGQIWLAAFLQLALFTYLYKENPAFRLAEHAMIGLAAAHSLVMNWDNYWKSTLSKDIPGGQWYLIIPLLLGLLIYFRYVPSLTWLARIPMSLWVGYGVGYTLAFSPRPFLNQVIASFMKLDTADNLVFFVTLVVTLSYFVFTISHEKVRALGAMSKLGRYAIMIALGSAFGNTVQGRVSLLLERFRFFLEDWLHLIKLG
ncbi:MAG TPA: hypothetical protein GXX30_06085 [Firmicutes bacterium]|nr:hypothetical protein [Candidatus Fermentithermobacillaceae bacterium]